MIKWIKAKISQMTLIRRCSFTICVVTVILLIAVNCLIPELLYQFLKPRMQQDLSILTEAVSTKVSYILHQNCQYLIRFLTDTDFQEALINVIEEGKEDAKEQLLSVLYEEKLGKMEPGSIRSTRNVVFVPENKPKLSVCRKEMEEYRKVLFQSDWYKNLKEELEDMEEEYPGELLRCYSPVFSRTDKTEEFISLVVKKNIEGHDIFLFLIEPFSDFQNIFSYFRDSGITDYALIGYKDKVLYKNQEGTSIENISDVSKEKLLGGNQNEVKILKKENAVMVGVRSSYKIEQFRIAAVLSKEIFLKPYQNWIHSFSFILVSFAVILLLLIVLILRHSFHSLEILTTQMKKIRDYDYLELPKIQETGEIGILADTFYKMMDKLRIQEETKKQIEYSLMVSQIDPHFIYNTLYTITYLAELNQTKDIMILNRALIGMLKDRLRSSKLQAFDTLEKEKIQIDNYITIQSYLCNNVLNVYFQIEVGCEKLNYPKNILQPFVENSIRHGILLHRDVEGHLIPGEIKIYIWKSNKRIETEILDNGTGMEKEKIQKYFYDEPNGDLKGEHIGIHNIRKRMTYLFGESYHLSAENLDDSGLKICFSFPDKTEEF